MREEGRKGEERDKRQAWVPSRPLDPNKDNGNSQVGNPTYVVEVIFFTSPIVRGMTYAASPILTGRVTHAPHPSPDPTK